MSNLFQFNEKSHRYTYDGKAMTGVTTILGVINKPALIPWATKMSATYIENNCEKNDDGNFIVSPEQLKASKSAHRTVRDNAANIGTVVHDIIEHAIKQFIADNEGKPKQIPKSFYQDKIKQLIKDKVIDVKQAVKIDDSIANFSEWSVQNVKQFLQSERRVYSLKHWFAGTYDLKYIDYDDNVWMADIKTSSGVYVEYFAQMGGYDVAEEESHPDDHRNIYGYVVIRLDKKTGKMEVVGMNDIQMCRDMFLHALGLYKIKNNIVI